MTKLALGNVARVHATALSRFAGASATGTNGAGGRGHAANNAHAPM
ncbi:MAG TPA: hypothetical protein VK467_07315 [Gemmatimonadales bacterium]|jgi:hypothetical protein|nr:hypothetical protein [Gemmatimonadales bacterium]